MFSACSDAASSENYFSVVHAAAQSRKHEFKRYKNNQQIGDLNYLTLGLEDQSIYVYLNKV